MQRVFRRDNPDRGTVSNPLEVPVALGQIGSDQQVRFYGEGVCISAFQAFADCFCAEWPAVRMADSDEQWSLGAALGYKAFKSALHRMRRRKAVGADGLGVDMLLAPGVPEEVLQLYFQGLRCCALQKEFPQAWQRVIYVLLVKPKKDKRLVQQRRDIALMAQGMKVLGQMLLMTAFHDMESRLAHSQFALARTETERVYHERKSYK